jgi:hypothetical protein
MSGLLRLGPVQTTQQWTRERSPHLESRDSECLFAAWLGMRPRVDGGIQVAEQFFALSPVPLVAGEIAPLAPPIDVTAATWQSTSQLLPHPPIPMPFVLPLQRLSSAKMRVHALSEVLGLCRNPLEWVFVVQTSQDGRGQNLPISTWCALKILTATV